MTKDGEDSNYAASVTSGSSQPCEHDSQVTDQRVVTTQPQLKTDEINEQCDASSPPEVAQQSVTENEMKQDNVVGDELTADREITDDDADKIVSKPKFVLKRLPSSNTEARCLPKANCTEKIILCIDHSATMFSSRFKRTVQSIKQTTLFHVLNGALKQFIMTKSFINKHHQFSLVMLNDDAQLITDFSQQGSDVLFMLQDIANNSQSRDRSDDIPECSDAFDLTNVFNLIDKHAQLPCCKQTSLIPPPFIVRVVLVYGRSNGKLGFYSGKESYNKLSQNPYFFIDTMYIHDEPSENNDVTGIFSCLCELDSDGSSYVLEVGVDGSMSALYNAFAKLLAHPLQRQRQVGGLNHDIMNTAE